VTVHFDYIDKNGGRYTRFVGDGIVESSTQRRHLITVTWSASNDLTPGDRIFVPKKYAAPQA
jgi:hypothetical protein